MKQYFLISLGYLILSCTSFQEVNSISQSNDYYLEIKQTVSGSSRQFTYVVTKNKLHILERIITRQGIAETKIFYSKKIRNVDNLQDIRKKTELLKNLNSRYINAQLGGLRWDVNFICGNHSKSIIIENTSILEINQLFDSINSIIPESKPKLHNSE